jgi:surface antigen
MTRRPVQAAALCVVLAFGALAFGAASLPIAAFADPPWENDNGNGWHDHHDGDDRDDDHHHWREDRFRDRAWDHDWDRDRGGGGVVVQEYDSVQEGTCDRRDTASAFSGSSNNVVGSLLGGAVGGLLGNQLGHGSGKTLTTIVGAIAGIMVGGAIGRSMEPADQGCVGQALEHGPNNQPVRWQNPNNGAQYQVVPTNTYQAQNGLYCREYQTTAVIDGQTQNTEGTACRQPDGSWRIQN